MQQINNPLKQAVNSCDFIRQPFAGKSAGNCPEPREFLWNVFVEKKKIFFPTKEKTSELTEKHFFPQIFLSILSKKKVVFWHTLFIMFLREKHDRNSVKSVDRFSYKVFLTFFHCLGYFSPQLLPSISLSLSKLDLFYS